MFSSIFKLKNLLYILQKEEYEIQNFLNWVRQNREWNNLEKKQKLVWTLKARLIFVLAIVIFVLALGGTFFVLASASNFLIKTWAIIAAFFIFLSFWLSPYLYLVVAVLILKPLDVCSKKFLIQKAKHKLRKFPHLQIFGITGSYGKTSVKEFLNTILQTKLRVLKTPENINTPLGISALIQKEDLSQYDVFLVEMGAYRRGDIKQVCDLVKPKFGILTGINEAHLERFENLKNTIKTKFELIESLPKEGKAFLNGEDKNVVENAEKFKAVEQEIYSQKMAEDLKCNGNGMEFVLKIDGEKIGFTVNLLGKHNLTNLLAGILVARELGLTVAEIQKGVSKIQAVEHRLQPIVNPNGVIVIDDSYNGNPTGVQAAIEVLKLFQNKRKILITPGLVEMGQAKKSAHIEIGEALSQVCDLVILIKNSNLPYFLQGLQKGGWNLSPENYQNEAKLKVFESSEEAHRALQNILQKGDVILFQNDWTDNYK